MSDGRCPSCLQPFVEANPEEAAQAVELQQQQRAEQLQQARQRGDGGGRDMLVGGAFFVGGTAFTAMSYMDAGTRPGGGTYVVCWGAILFGLVQFLRGIVKRF